MMRIYLWILMIGLAAAPAYAQAGPCSQAQPGVTTAIDAAMTRLEEARVTNSAAAMRDATDDLQALLLDIRSQLAPCSAMQAGAADPHAGHAMPAATAPVAGPPPAVRADAAPAPPTNIADLKCPTAVDPKTAPRMLHQGRMYYFCTEGDRAAFAKDPGKYGAAPAPAQAAPAHAH